MKTNNPWYSIWTNPRKTILEIVNDNPEKNLWILSFIYGFVSILNSVQSFGLGDTQSLLTILLIAVIFAPLWGRAVFAVWSGVVLLTGRWLKGKATFKTAQAAFAWASVPLLINIVCWALLILFFGVPLFNSDPNSFRVEGFFAFILVGALILKMVGAIWSLVIYINILSAVQKFSILRAISNILFSWVVLGIFFILIWLIGKWGAVVLNR